MRDSLARMEEKAWTGAGKQCDSGSVHEESLVSSSTHPCREGRMSVPL